MQSRCPACGYPGLAEPPWRHGQPSDEICPCCGLHFGYDDVAGGEPARRTAGYLRWRRRWAAEGVPRVSGSTSPQPGWDPAVQLRQVEQPE